jgi:hypothetical protein
VKLPLSIYLILNKYYFISMGSCLLVNEIAELDNLPIDQDKQKKLMLQKGETSVSLNPLQSSTVMRDSKDVTVQQIDSWLGENLPEEDLKSRR